MDAKFGHVWLAYVAFASFINIGETRDDQFFSPHFVALKNFSPFVAQSTSVHEPLDGWSKLRMTNHVALSFGGWCRRLVVGVNRRFDSSYLFKFSLFSGGLTWWSIVMATKPRKGGNKTKGKTSCAVPRTSLYPQAPPIWNLPMFITWNIVC